MGTADDSAFDLGRLLFERANDPIQTSAGPMQPQQIVDELTYCSYRANRRTMSAADLLQLFPQTGDAMEQRYQDGINAYAESHIRRDKEQPGWPDTDCDVFGRKLKEGT